jgi:hypothetical protein
LSPITAHPPTWAETGAGPPEVESFCRSASSFAGSDGCVSTTASGLSPEAAGSTTTSTSGPSAGLTSSVQLRPVFSSNDFWSLARNVS